MRNTMIFVRLMIWGGDCGDFGTSDTTYQDEPVENALPIATMELNYWYILNP